jgi:4-aminobutyrate aminotransferase-like enzyme
MAQLLAERFSTDPRLTEARRLILEALAEHQRPLTGIRPPEPDRRSTYDEMLARMGRLRGGDLYYPYLGSGFGRGPLVELADGSVKYDFISGIGVHYMGHSHPRIVEAGLQAALADTVFQGNLQQNTDSLDLVQLLVDTACRRGAKLEHCFLTSSGAMANENAFKLLFQKKHPANRVLAFEHAFAGRTLAMSQITDKAAYRTGLPQTLSVDYVPFFDAADSAGGTARALAALRQHLQRHPKQHAAMILELVQGEGGFNVGNRDFFLALIKVLKEHDVAVFVDEIQTFGRTTEPFAFQHFGLDEHVDVATIGKLTQVCATLFRDEYKPQPGLISQTFTGSTAAILAAQVILRHLLDWQYFGAEGGIAQLHRHFVDQLEQIAGRHGGWIQGPFGIGAMIAFTFLDGSEKMAKTLLHTLFELGVIGFVAGADPARVRFLIPAGGVEPADITAVCRILEQAMEQVAAQQA